MSDFSDRPFVAGSLIGLRTFQVDKLGRLTGVTHPDVWRPGENVAVCHRGSDQAQMWGFGHGGYSWTIPSGQFYISSGGQVRMAPSDPTVATEPEPVAEPAHDLVSIKCGCGFYAYFDGANDYMRGDRDTYATSLKVAGIVEGYGRVVVGSRGFRAEKSRILALIKLEPTNQQEIIRLTKLIGNYSVPWFDSEIEAVQQFPLTDADPITPDTCDDFWTRETS